MTEENIRKMVEKYEIRDNRDGRIRAYHVKTDEEKKQIGEHKAEILAYLKREELCAASLDLDHISGITYRAESGEVVERGPQRLLSLDEIPFYYDDMAGFEKRIV